MAYRKGRCKLAESNRNNALYKEGNNEAEEDNGGAAIDKILSKVALLSQESALCQAEVSSVGVPDNRSMSS